MADSPYVIGACELADARMTARMAERFEVEDARRRAFLARELARFYRCRLCGRQVAEKRVPTGLCSRCIRRPGQSPEQTQAMKTARNWKVRRRKG